MLDFLKRWLTVLLDEIECIARFLLDEIECIAVLLDEIVMLDFLLLITTTYICLKQQLVH
jgi:hypothetical protein